MTEDDARDIVAARWGGQGIDKVDAFVAMLIAENDQQNLVAPSTIPLLWERHVLDSAQLLDHAGDAWETWVDIGSGAGLPGIVIAILSGGSVTLIEPRRLRVEFLENCRDVLDLGSISIIRAKAGSVNLSVPADIVSARAVAKLDVLFTVSRGFATKATTFLLPKGASAQSEVATARRSWHGVFHVEQSIIDPKSGIVVASGIAPR